MTYHLLNKISRNYHFVIIITFVVMIAGCSQSDPPQPQADVVSAEEAHQALLKKQEEEKHKAEMAKAEAQRQEKLKATMQQRLQEGMAKIPKFNREEAIQKMVLEQFKVDINAVSRKLKTKAEVNNLIAKMALDEASLQYPESRRAEIIAQADKDFPLYKKGDKVDIKTIRSPISGVIEGIYPDKIKVDNLYILKDDIITPDPACFTEEKCVKRREHYVRVNFEIPKDDLVTKNKKELEKKVYKEQGFVMLGSEWVNLDALITAKIEPKVLEMEKAYYADHEEKLKLKISAELNPLETEEMIPSKTAQKH